MKILAIEKEVTEVDWSTVSKELLAQEAPDVYSMYLSDMFWSTFKDRKCSGITCLSKAKRSRFMAAGFNFMIFKFRAYVRDAEVKAANDK